MRFKAHPFLLLHAHTGGYSEGGGNGGENGNQNIQDFSPDVFAHSFE